MFIFDNIEKLEQNFKEQNRVFREIFASIDKFEVDFLENQLLSGSKRLRSTVLFLLILALGKEIRKEDILLSCAIELIHNASLIHDDIIDEAKIRRNKKTLNTLFNNKIAVVFGDLILCLAFEIFIELKDIKVLKYFQNTLKEMCISELFQQRTLFKITTIEEYIEKSERKTAKLFELSASSFAIMHDIEVDIKYRIENFAKNFGIAFQIRDDLNNILQEQDTKPLLNDMKNGIYTSCCIFASQDNKDILKLKGKKLLEEIRDKKNIEKTILLKEKYIEKAIDSISFLDNNEYKSKLIELAYNL